MFGNENSTDKCYINEWTFECSNICSCPNLDRLLLLIIMIYIVGISNATVSVDHDVYTVTLKALISYYEDYSYNQLPYHYVRSYLQ